MNGSKQVVMNETGQSVSHTYAHAYAHLRYSAAGSGWELIECLCTKHNNHFTMSDTEHTNTHKPNMPWLWQITDNDLHMDAENTRRLCITSPETAQ